MPNCLLRGTEEFVLSLSICSWDTMATHVPPVTDLSLQRPSHRCGCLARFPQAFETPRASHPFFSAVRSEHANRYQFDQSFLNWIGHGVSFTKQDSQTLVPFFSVKSTIRLTSISAPHFPQSSVGAWLISTLYHLCDDAGYQPGCAPILASRQAKQP